MGNPIYPGLTALKPLDRFLEALAVLIMSTSSSMCMQSSIEHGGMGTLQYSVNTLSIFSNEP